MATNIDRKLSEQQILFVDLYCDTENTTTFLNHREAYIQAGYSDKVNPASKAVKLLNKAYMKEAIKKAMPEVAYNEFILRKEYFDLYETAKDEGNLGVAAKLLDSMAKTERMFDNTVSDDGSTALRIKRAAEEATKDTFAKIAKEKEKRSNKIVKMNTDVTANG